MHFQSRQYSVRLKNECSILISALFISFETIAVAGFAGLLRAAMREAPGRTSLRIASRLPLSSGVGSVVTPVTLPPGWARLETSPLSPGYLTATNTIGTVLD